MTYFISGHRDLTQEEFDKHYIPTLENILKQDPMADFVVGDWEGCDTLALEWLISNLNYPDVYIYYVDNVRVTYCGEQLNNFYNVILRPCASYDECDSRMTQDSDFDIAWIRPDKEDSHTAMNIKRRYYGKV
jgi:hypothetical protein